VKAAVLTAPAGEHAAYAEAAREAFVYGFNEIVLIAAIVSFAGAALGLALVRQRDFVQPTGGESAPGG
jgi:hypothetical protein